MMFSYLGKSEVPSPANTLMYLISFSVIVTLYKKPLFNCITPVRYICQMCDFKDLERRGAFKILMGKSEANRPLRRPRRRWYDNIKMGHK
jgi:hypothetical protein